MLRTAYSHGVNEPKLPPYKGLRESIPGLSQRAVERALGWNTGRLSTIERGLMPLPEEHAALMAYLVRRITELGG